MFDKLRYPQYWFWPLLILILELLDKKDNLRISNAHDLELILGAIVGLAITLVNERGSIDQIKKNISDAFSRIEGQYIDIKKGNGFGAIIDPSQKNVFEGFIGTKYDAYNAPLKYEIEDLVERVRFHINRYKDKRFEMANYYYPIFASDDKCEVRDWMEGILEFYTYLEEGDFLTEDEKRKITFYVPDKSVYKFNDDLRITFFLGKKQAGEEVIFYVHNSIFMDFNINTPKTMFKPKLMFSIYDQEKIDWVRSYLKSTTKQMKALKGIKEFLSHLKTELKSNRV